ncbi:hypothetical protein BJ742DRAFT_842319 [Cladochytrium replicatum]|nr:hypothetical protein BJ742DRAFT_842319 [Cladochytrium replicatum]
MDPVVAVLLAVGISTIPILCGTLIRFRKAIFGKHNTSPPTTKSSPFRFISGVTLVLLLPTLLFRTAAILLLVIYFPEEIRISTNLRRMHLNWDRGVEGYVTSIVMIVGDVLQPTAAYCYFLVLLDRYHVFRSYLPLGRSIIFWWFLLVFYTLLYLSGFTQFIVMNAARTEPFTPKEQLFLALMRSLTYVAIAILDLWVSLFVCRAAFSTTSLEYWERHLPGSSREGRNHEDGRSESWSLQKRPNLRNFVGSSGEEAGSGTSSLGELRSANQSALEPPVNGRAFAYELATSHFTSPSSTASPNGAPPPIPSPEPALSLYSNKRTIHPVSLMTAISRSPPHRYTLTLLVTALLTDAIGVFLYMSHLVIKDLKPYTSAIEYVSSCTITMHISIAVFLMRSFKDVVNLSTGSQ